MLQLGSPDAPQGRAKAYPVHPVAVADLQWLLGLLEACVLVVVCRRLEIHVDVIGGQRSWGNCNRTTRGFSPGPGRGLKLHCAWGQSPTGPAGGTGVSPSRWWRACLAGLRPVFLTPNPAARPICTPGTFRTSEVPTRDFKP